ncbi:MAG TPA: hypothetical protein PLG52_09380, partial [Anaerolineales bacterium]|nr:hypothetical protein [Anaerolineales bacterium]
MYSRLNASAKSLHNTLTANSEFLKLFAIPSVLFCLDFIFRASFGLDLADAGADMALMAIATFSALVLDDKVMENKQTLVVCFFYALLFFVPWVICLKIISNNPMMIFDVLDFRLVLSWLIGGIAFIFSG